MKTTGDNGSPRGLGGSILQNVTSSWASLVVNIVVSFFMAPFIVDRLGSLHYGIWILLSQFTGYLWLFDFGVRESVIKYVAQYHATGRNQELSDTVNAALFLYSGIAIVTLLVTGGMTFALPYVFNIPADSISTARLVLVMAGGGIAQAFVFNVFVGVLMGLQRFYFVSRLGTLFGLLRAALTLLALSNGGGIIALSVIQLALGTTANLLTLWLARRSLPEYRPRLVLPHREQFTQVVGYAKYVLANNIGEKIVFTTDAFVLGMLMPVSMLTYYAIPASLVMYVRSIMLAMASVLNPVSSAMDARQDNGRLNALFLGACKGAVLIGMPICVGLIVLGKRFIELWMGPSFAVMSGPIIGVLGAAYLFGLPHYCISAVLYGLGRHRIMAGWRAAEAVVNLCLSLILVYKFGLIGAALGTMIPHVLLAVVVLPRAMAGVLGFRLRDYYVSTYVRPFVAVLPFVAICGLIETVVRPQSLVTLASVSVLGLAVYAIPTWYIALSPTERGRVLARINKIPLRAYGIGLTKSVPAGAGSREA